MSVTESKAKTERKSSRKPAKTQETVLSALLAQTEEVSVPLASLIKSPLNVRTVPYSAESVSELADSIKGVGLLQNLVVHALPGDRYGVAAGGRRLAALNMLAERDIIQVDWPVRVKVIPQELATAASMTENGHRRDMHPAEQIAGFRAMAQEGKTPAQIGDLLGYSPRHVQRMLKLADLAPVILDALAEDRITTEHCQALALENDTARQVQVFEAACQSGWGGKPAQISLECKHYSLTSDAPSGKEGAAFMALMAEKARLVVLLPEGWSRDMTTFLSLSQEVLLSLLSFCTACSIHGVQTRECGHTSRSPLDPLETAIGFHMRDWWQPTKANFFGHLKKPQIIAALNEAGLSGAARDAEKMKKGDAAEHAEFHMKDNRWVPGWMCAPRPQTDATERTDNLADAA
ncbi:ParB/RepB/Spo0J family partition protein [Escherichia coli]|uniref:ParB/RepB/Spo0J family partition protein n=1 Tax=Escherichia coli TaxID=562 RepID=UPI001A8C6C22|nr:ParB/RepB/Spo0J family partition protein [Escherichia coli]MBO0263431.1 ParB/RepB/Spo0J family partition protein [Escherichia coli]